MLFGKTNLMKKETKVVGVFDFGRPLAVTLVITDFPEFSQNIHIIIDSRVCTIF